MKAGGKKINQKSNKMSFSLVELQEYKEVSMREIEIRGQEFIGWGSDNRYPNYLYRIYSNCATLQSIINGSIDYTIGNGISFEGIPEYIIEENNIGDTLYDTCLKLIRDRWIFGGFALKLRFNGLGGIASVEYVDFLSLRTSADGLYVYEHDWEDRYGKNRAVKYSSYLCDDEDPVKIFYYKGTKTRGCYPIPDYSAAIISAETQIEIQQFHYNNIINNFSSNKIINFNNAEGIDDSIKEEIERKVIEKYTGTKHAGTLMVSFNGHKDNAMTVESIPDDSFDTKYNTLAPETRENLFISMRAQPQLFGLNLSTGFNEQEFNEAFALYNKTAIVPKQNEIKRIFKKLFENSNVIFSPFKLGFEEIEVNNRAEDIPDNLLSDLTQDERRELIGYDAINDSTSQQSILAERLGVGGTEALVSIVNNSETSEDTKRGLLQELFGFTNEQIDNIFKSNDNELQ